jgi:serine/threonine-protein kinase RsbW
VGPAFSDATLDELLRALQARAIDHPSSPGLIASWPGVPAASMPAACAELRRRGHAVQEIAILGARDKVRRGWTMAPAEAPPPRLGEELTVLVREVAEPRTVALARTLLAEVAERENASPSVRAALALAVTEACSNVVRHAYADRELPGEVEVRVGRVDEVMTVEVADHGRGMVPRFGGGGPGIGLALIASLADVVEIRGRHGTVVRMQFALEGEDATPRR